MMWHCTLMPFIVVVVKLSPLLEGFSMPVNWPLLPDCASPYTFAKFRSIWVYYKLIWYVVICRAINLLINEKNRFLIWALNVYSALKTLSVEFMVCSIVVVDTCSKRTRFPELPCSTSRLTCLSTNLSVSSHFLTFCSNFQWWNPGLPNHSRFPPEVFQPLMVFGCLNLHLFQLKSFF